MNMKERIYWNLRNEMMEYVKNQYSLTIFIYTAILTVLALSFDLDKGPSYVPILSNIILFPGLIRVIGIRKEITQMTVYLKKEDFFDRKLVQWDKEKNGLLYTDENIKLFTKMGKKIKLYEFPCISVLCTVMYWSMAAQNCDITPFWGIISIVIPIIMFVFSHYESLIEKKSNCEE